jgi:LmbE family N-acetylglucosaminyl deacetylase
MSRVLVLSPHPDDESIGCGGTLHGHAADGDEIKVVFLTSGELGGHGLSKVETQALRETEAEEAAKILGISSIEFWRQPDGGLTANRRLVERVRQLILAWAPKYIYVPHDTEMHDDHRAAARMLKRALANTPQSERPSNVRMFEVWTPIQKLDEIIDISPFIEIKVAAIRAYTTQCSVMDFDEAFRGLSRYRGELHSWPGGDYAEVFVNPRFQTVGSS